jgi:hypothetical protein
MAEDSPYRDNPALDSPRSSSCTVSVIAVRSERKSECQYQL